MRLTFRNKNKCLVCNKSIIYSELYKCYHCTSLYHNNCLNDMLFVNNNKKCIYCQKSINKSKLSFTYCIYDIVKKFCLDLIPLCCVVGSIFGLLIFFAPK